MTPTMINILRWEFLSNFRGCRLFAMLLKILSQVLKVIKMKVKAQ